MSDGLPGIAGTRGTTAAVFEGSAGLCGVRQSANNHQFNHYIIALMSGGAGWRAFFDRSAWVLLRWRWRDVARGDPS